MTVPMDSIRQAELELCIQLMKLTAREFYSLAVGVHNHAFVEFTGLMQDYIKCCEDALKQGIDFTNLNVHAGQYLPIAAFRAKYLTEKLNCIYGSTAKVEPTI